MKPAYDDFIKPTMKHADIIVPFVNDNENAVSMLVQNLQIKLRVMKQQKRDILQGFRVRTFSDILGTPDYRHQREPKPAMITDEQPFVTFADGDKQKEKVALLKRVYEEMRQSGEGKLSEAEVFTLRQLIKSLAGKFAKLVAKDMQLTLKMAAQSEFQKGVVFCPELVTEAQAAEVSKQIAPS